MELLEREWGRDLDLLLTLEVVLPDGAVCREGATFYDVVWVEALDYGPHSILPLLLLSEGTLGFRNPRVATV
jgi:FAD/FMN-containing dehydrogenase